MLVRLTVENFAILERADLEFAPGLNALTGQTGAGKSLLIDALSCILGERASSGFLRKGCDEGLVEAFFVVEDARLAARISEILGSPLDGGELLLRRRLLSSGRFPAEINGRSAPVAALKAIGELLVDIHGQNEHQRLISPAAQLEELDLYAGLERERAAFEAAWRELRQRWRELQRLRREKEELEREKEFLEHRVNEIESARIASEDELEELRAEHEAAAHHQEIAEAVSAVRDRLYSSEGSASAVVERLMAKLSRLEGISKDIDRWTGMLSEAKVLLGEVGLEAGRFLSAMDHSPARLEKIQDRIATLRGLCRKYGPTLANCVETLKSEQSRLDELGSIDIRIEDAEKAAKDATDAAAAAGAPLSKKRTAAAGKLSRAVEKHLGELGMKEARFRMDFTEAAKLETPGDVEKVGRAGLESVEFMMMPNPGEGWAPLRKIASAGEISRAMLALKSVLAAVDRVPVLVFDEIDADIGGRMGETVGRKLAALSAHHQVVLVTHLPQIAAFAEKQFTVTKAGKGARTVTEVHALSREGRLAELAEMLRGPEKSGEAMGQAEKMLSAAEARGS